LRVKTPSPKANPLRRKLLAIMAVVPLALAAEPVCASPALGRALGRRFAAKHAGAQAARAAAPNRALGDKPVDVLVRRRDYPQAAAHVEHAQRLGQPTILTLDRRHAAARRHDSLYGVGKNGARPGKGYDRDEYPFAVSSQGGSGASVKFVPAHENRGAGAAIARQVRHLPDGTRIRVTVTD
jgi:hypothetical protein